MAATVTDQTKPYPADGALVVYRLEQVEKRLDTMIDLMGPLATHEDRLTRVESLITRLSTGLIALTVTVLGGIITYLITH